MAVERTNRHPWSAEVAARTATTVPPGHGETVARLRAVGCVFAEDEAGLLVEGARTPAELEALVVRREGGEPLEQVLGWAEFCGLRIAVDPGVFVPRRRTELMVREAVALLRAAADAGSPDAAGAPPVVVDLCCGSGAVGAAVGAAVGRIELHATDIEPAAVRCARRNIGAAGGRVHQGDLDAPLPAAMRGRVAVIVANVPYVPTEAIGTMPPEARLHEPRIALDGGADGLDVLRRVAAVAPGWLAPGGHLLVEVSGRQSAPALEAFDRSGLAPRLVTSDVLAATVVIGTQPTA